MTSKSVFQNPPAARALPDGGRRLARHGAGTSGRLSPRDERPRGFATRSKNGRQVGTFTGEITELAFRTNRLGQLVVDGVLNGTVTLTNGTTQQITDLLFRGIRALLQPGGNCTILTLDIGRIELNVLGLKVNIAPIEIDITGVTGPGQLLGNLLCALSRLLD